MKKMIKKAAAFCKKLFGWGIFFALLGGGAMFPGYLIALCIGGDTAAAISEWIYKSFVPVLVKFTTALILLGLISMYLSGEQALTAKKQSSSNAK